MRKGFIGFVVKGEQGHVLSRIRPRHTADVREPIWVFSQLEGCKVSVQIEVLEKSTLCTQCGGRGVSVLLPAVITAEVLEKIHGNMLCKGCKGTGQQGGSMPPLDALVYRDHERERFPPAERVLEKIEGTFQVCSGSNGEAWLDCDYAALSRVLADDRKSVALTTLEDLEILIVKGGIEPFEAIGEMRRCIELAVRAA